MSTREIDLGGSEPLIAELAFDRVTLRGEPAPVIQLPRRAEPVRFSKLKRMDESPAHYLVDAEETSPMRKGTALHAYLLGQKDRVVVFDGRRDPRSEKWKEFQQEHKGKCILIQSEADVVQAMRRSVEKHARAMELLEGVQEQRIEWEFSGRRCAGTPDVFRDFSDRRRVVELKSTRSAKPRRLLAQARYSHWHAQVGWYGEGLDRALSVPPLPCTDHYLVAVESVAPFCVTTVHVSPTMIAAGARAWRFWWERLQNCEQSNHWPGYSEADEEWEDDAPDSGDAIDWEGIDAA